MKRRVLLFSALVWVLCGWSQQRISALFVGNSYTFFNDMPGMVAQMAASRGDTLIQQKVVANRYSFEKHFKDTVTLHAIASQPFDRIVLQEWHVRSGYPEDFFEQFTVAYADSLLAYIEAHQACVQPYLYMPWARESGNVVDCPSDPTVCTYEGMRDRIFQNFHHLRQHTGLPVAPIGAVWDYLRQLYPWLDLYDASDRHHPNLAGSYVSACVHYVMLFRKSPAGTYYPPSLPASLAELIQQEVWLLMQDLQPEWAFDMATAPNGGIGAEKLNSNTYRFSLNVHHYDAFWWRFSDGTQSVSANPVKVLANNCPLTANLYIVDACDTMVFERVIRPAGSLRTFSTLTHPTCAGLENGKIALQVTNTVGNVQFQWSSGQTSATLENLSSGTYTVTVSDASGCVDKRSYNLRYRRTLVPNFNVIPECSGASNAQIRSTVRGGYPPYAYQWAQGNTSANLAGLSFGSYSVSVQDARGCTLHSVVMVDSGSVCRPTDTLWYEQVTPTSMVLKWRKVPCALSYRVEYRLNGNPDAAWTLILTNTLADTFLLTNLTPATVYQVRLRTRCGAADWLASPSQNITTPGQVRYYDGDRDGFGQEAYMTTTGSSNDPNLSAVAGDCDDSNAAVSPTAAEFCDQLDNNCNGLIDEPLTACPIPESPLAVQVTAASALMSWKSGTCDVQYRVRHKLTVATDWVSQLLPSGQLSYLVTGYNPGNEIQFAVQRVCNNATFSGWSVARKVIFTDEPFVVTSEPVIENLTAQTQETVGIHAAADLKVWPNPATTTLHVRLPRQPEGIGSKPCVIKIYSGFGSFVAAYETDTPDDVMHLNISHLPSGIYIVKANDAFSGERTCTFIKTDMP